MNEHFITAAAGWIAIGAGMALEAVASLVRRTIDARAKEAAALQGAAGLVAIGGAILLATGLFSLMRGGPIP